MDQPLSKLTTTRVEVYALTPSLLSAAMDKAYTPPLLTRRKASLLMSAHVPSSADTITSVVSPKRVPLVDSISLRW